MSIINKKRILVVDDEPAIRELCRRTLNDDIFEVDTSPDGTTAQSMIIKSEYDLYLLDIRMPQLSGRELYKWLQEEYPDSASKVVFITGSAIGQDTQAFQKTSGRPILLKPFTASQLEEVVREFLKYTKPE